MLYAVIENTDIRVSRVSFGTASMHHLFSAAQRLRLLAAAAEAGVTHFDTSPYYGYGLAESDLGKFLRGRRSGLTVATKVGLYASGRATLDASSVWARKLVGKIVPIVSRPAVSWQVDRARSSLRASLRRLGTDWVDFLYLHEPDNLLIETDEFLRWIQDEHAKGTVRSWGLAGDATRVMSWVRSSHPLAQVIQTPDSLAKREANFLVACGRNLQFTYGYHRSRSVADGPPESVLKKALQRNATGSVITTTRELGRIVQLGECER